MFIISYPLITRKINKSNLIFWSISSLRYRNRIPIYFLKVLSRRKGRKIKMLTPSANKIRRMRLDLRMAKRRVKILIYPSPRWTKKSFSKTRRTI